MSRRKRQRSEDGEAPSAPNGAAEPLSELTGAESAAGEAPAPPAALEDELSAAKREAAESYDRYLRTRAELDNVLKRQERERRERAKYAAEAIARDILGAVDDLERAVAHAGEDGDGTGLAEGVELVLKNLTTVLERHGIKRLEAEGQPFDPAVHEAVNTVETDQAEPNTVVADHRPGYTLHDRLLRASMVAVAKAPADPDNGDN